MVAFDRAAQKTRRDDRHRREPGLRQLRAGRRLDRRRRRSVTSCTISAGTPAAARSSTRATTWTGLARRYLLVPGLRSSNIYVLDTEPDPRQPALVKTIDGKDAVRQRPATRARTPCTADPDGVFLTCLGGAEGDDDGPGGIALLDHETVRGAARLGDRPRAAALPLRRLVAPQPERADLQRVGQPVDDRGRHRAGAAAGPEVRPRHPLLGSRRGQARAARRPRRPAPDGAGGPARRTTRRRPGASSAW